MEELNNKIPEDNQGLTPSEPNAGATEKISIDQLAGKTPEELVDWYNNTLEMHRAANQKYQEAAELLRKAEENQKIFQAEIERLREERDRSQAQLLEVMQRLNSLSPVPPPHPNLDELSPDEGYKYIVKENLSLKNELDRLKKDFESKLGEISHFVIQAQKEAAFEKFLKENIFPKYPDVTKARINAWIMEHYPDPNKEITPQMVERAAAEIQKEIDQKAEAKAQELLKRKQELAEQAQNLGGGANVGLLPGGKSFSELPEEQQAEILAKMYKKMANL